MDFFFWSAVSHANRLVVSQIALRIGLFFCFCSFLRHWRIDDIWLSLNYTEAIQLSFAIHCHVIFGGRGSTHTRVLPMVAPICLKWSYWYILFWIFIKSKLRLNRDSFGMKSTFIVNWPSLRCLKAHLKFIHSGANFSQLLLGNHIFHRFCLSQRSTISPAILVIDNSA